MAGITTSGTAAGATNPGLCEGRLTLTSGTPVTTADVTGATTMYFAPYGGSRLALYDGAAWVEYTFTELSLALGTLTNALPYDVFVYANAGTPTLEFLAWTSDTARATALTTQNGVLSKTGALTRRYLGTFRTTSTTATEDSALKRFVWNYYNRAARQLFSCPAYNNADANTTWTSASTTWAAANGGTGSKVECVIGWAEDAVDIHVAMEADNDGLNGRCSAGAGIDSVTSVTAIASVRSFVAGNSSADSVDYIYVPAVGYHHFNLLVRVSGGTGTWVADLARSGAAADPYTTYITVLLNG